jgi:hypothetical protein
MEEWRKLHNKELLCLLCRIVRVIYQTYSIHGMRNTNFGCLISWLGEDNAEMNLQEITCEDVSVVDLIHGGFYDDNNKPSCLVLAVVDSVSCSWYCGITYIEFLVPNIHFGKLIIYSYVERGETSFQYQ